MNNKKPRKLIQTKKRKYSVIYPDNCKLKSNFHKSPRKKKKRKSESTKLESCKNYITRWLYFIYWILNTMVRILRQLSVASRKKSLKQYDFQLHEAVIKIFMTSNSKYMLLLAPQGSMLAQSVLYIHRGYSQNWIWNIYYNNQCL